MGLTNTKTYVFLGKILLSQDINLLECHHTDFTPTF